MIQENSKEIIEAQKQELLRIIFENHEAKSNFVGAFDLLLKVDKRKNPDKYKKQVEVTPEKP